MLDYDNVYKMLNLSLSMSNFVEELENSGSYRVAHAKIRTAVGEAQDSLRRIAPNNPLLKLMSIGRTHLEFCPGFSEVSRGMVKRPEQDGMYIAVARYVGMLNAETEAIGQCC